MATDENISHINGNIPSCSSLLKLVEYETSKTMEEKNTQEVYAISERLCFDERVRFDARFI